MTIKDDLYSKVTRALPTFNTTSSYIASIFFANWISTYGIPRYLLSENGPQFLSKFFKALCGYFVFNELDTTACHPHTNGHTERYNKTISARILHYVAEHQSY